MPTADFLGISDEDLCSLCRHLAYLPGELSHCYHMFPGKFNGDGYCVDCGDFWPVEKPGNNWAVEEVETCRQ